jgi:hypothetical protein
MEETSCKIKIMRDCKGQLNSIFGEKDTLKEKKLSCGKHGKRQQKWQEKETQKMAVGRKMEGDGQECIGK